MSHTIRKINLGNTAFAESTIVDYVHGGESYTLAELGITGPISFIVFLLPATFYINTQLVIPKLQGGLVILESSPTVEIPSQVGINFIFVAIIHGA